VSKHSECINNILLKGWQFHWPIYYFTYYVVSNMRTGFLDRLEPWIWNSGGAWKWSTLGGFVVSNRWTLPLFWPIKSTNRYHHSSEYFGFLYGFSFKCSFLIFLFVIVAKVDFLKHRLPGTEYVQERSLTAWIL